MKSILYFVKKKRTSNSKRRKTVYNSQIRTGYKSHRIKTGCDSHKDTNSTHNDETQTLIRNEIK